MKIAICFAQFGPYHHARVRALQQAADTDVVPLQLAGATSTYAWEAGAAQCDRLLTLCDGVYEDLSPLRVLSKALRFFRREQIDVVLLPSYAPAAETALFVAAKLAGLRCIMMNESHAGTERATGWKKQLKRLLVGRFDAALIGGQPQKRHFINLGLPSERIFTGYDAIDNRYFEQAAAKVRSTASAQRKALGLPDRYFLSLGRMVPKKNLSCLVQAYAAFVAKLQSQNASAEVPALVFVGSGSEESALKALCKELKLPIIDHPTDSQSLVAQRAKWEPSHHPTNSPSNSLTVSPINRLTTPPPHGPSVHFYGFRQISENPAFYALAEAFILPSLWEEWGLVVNEAMACGLPVLVSQTVGSAEDLVHDGENGYTFDPQSTEALAHCLEQIAENPKRRQAMGRKSHEIIQNWGCDNFAKNALAAVG